jgi:hypothetical protein
VIEAKPLAYWRMNEMSAGTARAAVGTTKRRTRTASSSGLTARRPAAFDGPGPDQPRPHFAGGRMTADLGKRLPADYAVELWFWNGLAHEARPVAGYLFSRGADEDKQAIGDHLGIGGTSSDVDAQGRLFVFNGNGRKQALAGRTTIVPKTWNQVVFARQGRHVQVYLNGGTEPEISGELEPTFAADGGTVFFGGRNDNFANLEGKVDEAAVYDRPLTAADAAAHFQVAGVVTLRGATALAKPAAKLPPPPVRPPARPAAACGCRSRGRRPSRPSSTGSRPGTSWSWSRPSRWCSTRSRSTGARTAGCGSPRCPTTRTGPTAR